MTDEAATTGQLKQFLLEGASLLESVGESWWSRKMKTAASAALNDPDTILSWFGGMGSLNDRLISRVNGDAVEPSQESEFNAKLEGLRERIYLLAQRLGSRLDRRPRRVALESSALIGAPRDGYPFGPRLACA